MFQLIINQFIFNGLTMLDIILKKYIIILQQELSH